MNYINQFEPYNFGGGNGGFGNNYLNMGGSSPYSYPQYMQPDDLNMMMLLAKSGNLGFNNMAGMNSIGDP